MGARSHAPVVAGVVFLPPFLPQAFEEEGRIGAADEGEGYSQKNFGEENSPEGLRHRIRPPAGDAEDRCEVEGQAVAEPVGDIPRRIFHHEGRQGENPLQKQDLGQGEADMILPEKSDDGHGEQGHLQEGKGVKFGDVGGRQGIGNQVVSGLKIHVSPDP